MLMSTCLSRFVFVSVWFTLLCPDFTVQIESNQVTVFMNTLTPSLEVKKHQQRIQSVLSSMNIHFTTVDVSANYDDLVTMREIADDMHALAPQIANGGAYCGDYEAFNEAVESKTLAEFLKLK